jgi:hypothetical protein
MRTTIDIPDPVYRDLKIEAAKTGTSVKALILKKVAPGTTKRGKRVTLPLIESKRPGWLKLDNARIAEIAPFP